MSQEMLNVADISSGLKQEGRNGVTQQVRVKAFQSSAYPPLPESCPHCLLRKSVPALIYKKVFAVDLTAPSVAIQGRDSVGIANMNHPLSAPLSEYPHPTLRQINIAISHRTNLKDACPCRKNCLYDGDISN
jgi:hypothetical protein